MKQINETDTAFEILQSSNHEETHASYVLTPAGLRVEMTANYCIGPKPMLHMSRQEVKRLADWLSEAAKDME